MLHGILSQRPPVPPVLEPPPSWVPVNALAHVDFIDRHYYADGRVCTLEEIFPGLDAETEVSLRGWRVSIAASRPKPAGPLLKSLRRAWRRGALFVCSALRDLHPQFNSWPAGPFFMFADSADPDNYNYAVFADFNIPVFGGISFVDGRDFSLEGLSTNPTANVPNIFASLVGYTTDQLSFTYAVCNLTQPSGFLDQGTVDYNQSYLNPVGVWVFSVAEWDYYHDDGYIRGLTVWPPADPATLHSFDPNYGALANFGLGPTYAPSDVKLDVNFSGADGATDATDASPSNHDLSFVGGAQIQSNKLLLNGTNAYVTVPNSFDFQLQDKPFCIEMRIRFLTLPVISLLCGPAGTIPSWRLYCDGVKLYFNYSSDGNGSNSLVTPDLTFNTSSTYKIVVERDEANSLRIFLDDVMVAKLVNHYTAYFNGSGPLVIGNEVPPDGFLHAEIDDLLIIKDGVKYGVDAIGTAVGTATGQGQAFGQKDTGGFLVGTAAGTSTAKGRSQQIHAAVGTAAGTSLASGTWIEGWTTTFQATMDTNSGIGTGANFRQRIPASLLSVSGAAVRIYVTSGISFSCKISSMYIGRPAASGDLYDFEPGTMTQVTWGGSPSIVIGAGPTVMASDAIAHNLDADQDTMIAIWATPSTDFCGSQYTETGVADAHGYIKFFSGPDETNVADVSGYGPSSAGTPPVSHCRFITKIEVPTPPPTPIVATATGTGAAEAAGSPGIYERAVVAAGSGVATGIAPALLTGITATAGFSASRSIKSGYFGSWYTDAGGGAISSFNDQTGNDRHFTDGGTANKRPTLTTAGPLSRECLDFNSATTDLIGPNLNTLLSGSAGYVAITLMVDSANGTNSTDAPYNNDIVLVDVNGLFGLTLRGNTSPITVQAWNWDGNYDIASAALITTGVPHLIEWRHESNVIYLRVDGGPEVSLASGNPFYDAIPVHLGNMTFNSANALDAKVFEMYFATTVPSLALRDEKGEDMMDWVGIVPTGLSTGTGTAAGVGHTVRSRAVNATGTGSAAGVGSTA